MRISDPIASTSGSLMVLIVVVEVFGKSGSGESSILVSDVLSSGCACPTSAVVDVLGKSGSGDNSMRHSDLLISG